LIIHLTLIFNWVEFKSFLNQTGYISLNQKNIYSHFSGIAKKRLWIIRLIMHLTLIFNWVEFKSLLNQTGYISAGRGKYFRLFGKKNKKYYIQRKLEVSLVIEKQRHNWL